MPLKQPLNFCVTNIYMQGGQIGQNSVAKHWRQFENPETVFTAGDSLRFAGDKSQKISIPDFGDSF